MLQESKTRTLRCSFCNKTQDEVAKLIAGPRVYICGACVGVCNKILEEDRILPADEAAARGPESVS